MSSGIFNRSTSVAGLIAEAYEVQDFQLLNVIVIESAQPPTGN